MSMNKKENVNRGFGLRFAWGYKFDLVVFIEEKSITQNK